MKHRRFEAEHRAVLTRQTWLKSKTELDKDAFFYINQFKKGVVGQLKCVKIILTFSPVLIPNTN